jgi:hypothetical protein
VLPKKTSERRPTRAPEPVPGLPTRVVDESGFDEDVSTLDPDRPPSVDELKARRRPLSQDDRRVSDAALTWMSSLPRDRRLMYTMLDYPHVVNTLAQRWGDRQALGEYLESLLHSRRRYRAGFSAPAQAELDALAEWARSQGLVT